MKRLSLIAAASWMVLAASARAGELDSEYGPTATATGARPLPSIDRPSSELDAESPTQAFFHGGYRRRFFGGFGFGYGYPFFGGFGYGYPGFGYGGFGYGRGFGYGYPGFAYGGFGYGRGFGGYGRRF